MKNQRRHAAAATVATAVGVVTTDLRPAIQAPNKRLKDSGRKAIDLMQLSRTNLIQNILVADANFKKANLIQNIWGADNLILFSHLGQTERI